MLVVDPIEIENLLASFGSKAEALEIVDDSRARAGESSRFGMMRFSTSESSKGWMLVSQQTACRYAERLNANGLTRDQIRKLLGDIGTEVSAPAMVDIPSKRGRPKGSKNQPKLELPMQEAQEEVSKYTLEYALRLRASKSHNQ